MAIANENLSSTDFERLRSLIYQEAGIRLTPEKKTMLEVRLRQRLRGLQLSSCTEYCNFLFGAGSMDHELVHLIDAVTTNKTDFFREPDHFDFLASSALDEIYARLGPGRELLAWSAGCSTGEEPYTLAMVLNEYAENKPGFRFHILATDICTKVLDKARMGVFTTEMARPVPLPLRKKYFMFSRDRTSTLMRIVPELRARIEFRRVNLMDAEYGLTEIPQIIFCRNVIIYFDRPTQAKLLQNLVRNLAPGGFFFAGHSESLQNMNLPLESVGPVVYRKHP